jgi:hypothetical protein
VILPVWALLDGDTPVAGARVQVYAREGRAFERLHPVIRPPSAGSGAG